MSPHFPTKLVDEYRGVIAKWVMFIENAFFGGKLEFNFLYIRIRALGTEQIWENKRNEVGYFISKWTLCMLIYACWSLVGGFIAAAFHTVNKAY